MKRLLLLLFLFLFINCDTNTARLHLTGDMTCHYCGKVFDQNSSYVKSLKYRYVYWCSTNCYNLDKD